MTAVSFHCAPPAESLQFHAHQLFGILLYREQGKSVREIAGLLCLAEDHLDAALAGAERGEVARVPAYEGSTLKIRDARGKRYLSAAKGDDELFLSRWQRVLLRQLCQNGGEITVAEANAIRCRYPDGLEAGISALHKALKAHHMALDLFDRDGRGVYRITDEQLATLRDIIANRWRFPQ